MENQVSGFFDNTEAWHNEMRHLRSIILETGLVEELKWKQPCYTWKGKNIVIIGKRKSCCVLGFFKGVLLKDSQSLMVSPGENSQHVRQLNFNSIDDIQKKELIIKAYIHEAIEVEKLGLKVKVKEVTEFDIPEELIRKFAESAEFQSAFKSLTPGRQKGYLLHFTQAKQSSTRITRIEKYSERIMMGKGLNDCICGQSKRMPNCDGSHKYINQ